MTDTATDPIHHISDGDLVGLTDAVNRLIDVTNRQNEMLGLIVDEIKPTLDALKESPLGMMLGVKA